MSTITYKILDTKRMSANRDYFVTTGENETTIIKAIFPNAYTVTDGWGQYVVFQTTTDVTIGDITSKTPKIALVNGEYTIPNTLANAGITRIQFQAEKWIDGVLNRFETEEKLFPRIGLSLTGYTGASVTLPNVYVTQDTLNSAVGPYSELARELGDNETQRVLNESGRILGESDRDAFISQFKDWYNATQLTGKLPLYIDGGDFGDTNIGTTYDGGDF